MNIYVGNLPPDVSEDDLRQAFEVFGKVTSATVIKDIFSGTSKGFGFVEMPAKAEAQAAINGLNSKELKGKMIVVNEARPREEKRRGGGGGRGGSGGRGSSGGGGRGGRYGSSGSGGRRRF
ncbi:MAG: RNA-binding protein [Candidatus Jettenia sp.]|nr:MAG: RNA-binding protein [Candidatus Jettenia sp.]